MKSKYLRGDKMSQSNSKSKDSKNQSLTKETEQKKHNMPKKDVTKDEPSK